jgi:hypothetical protein
MDELKKAFEALKASIDSCGDAGVHGTKVAELKELAAKTEEELKKLEE